MLSNGVVLAGIQASSTLAQCSVATLSLLHGHCPWPVTRAHSSTAHTNSSGALRAGPLIHQHEHPSSAPTAAGSQSQHLSFLLNGLNPLSKARLHHAAVDLAGSDEETAASNSTVSSSQHAGRANMSWLDRQQVHQQQQMQQQRHQQQHVGQLHNMAHSQQSVAQQQHTRYEGHLHAPHGRRHATSRSQIDRFISEQLLSCKSLGMLRRIQIKHKATMEPEHVADTLLCLQHLVRAARYARQTGMRSSFPFMHHATSQARSQPRVRAAGEFSRSRVRASESDGHMEQLMAQMLGELGSQIWFMMGDMTGPDLAKVLYSWAMLEWHPEPELLADVKASFISAAAGGGMQQQRKSSPQQQPGQQQWAELEVWQGPWMAAGLWGLLKLGEPCEGRVLQLVQQHWQQLVRYWTPQQVSDIAGALALTADEQVAAAVTAGGDEAEQVAQQEDLQLAHLVLGLCRHMLSVLGQKQEVEGANGLLVPLPWPESMLIQLQTSLLNAGVPAAQRAAAAVSEIAASATSSSAAAGAEAAARDVPMMAVQNVPQLAWRMLQALAAVGVNVSEPEDAAVGAIVAALSEATKVPMGGNRML